MVANTAEGLNDLSNRIIGFAIDIHKKLGPGFQEKIYEEALLKEFQRSEIGFEKQKVIRVDYDGQNLENQRIDLLVDDGIILEIKACTKTIPIHRDQLISYLKTANKKLRLILNFGRSKLEIKRVVHHFSFCILREHLGRFNLTQFSFAALRIILCHLRPDFLIC